MNFDKGIPTIPKSKVVFFKSSFQNTKSSHKRCVEDHYFNHQIEICLPIENNSKEFEKIMNQILEFEKDHFYYIGKTCLKDIVQDAYTHFQKGCQVYSISLSTQIDVSNTFVILPTGVLILSLTKDTYEKLGLQGRKGEFNDKYIVEVNFGVLKKESIGLNKLLDALAETLPVFALLSIYKGICFLEN